MLLPFLLITLIWSSTWIVIKDQLGPVPSEGVPPPWSVTYRFLIAAGAMFLLARLGGLRFGLDLAGHRLAMLTGVLQFVLNYNLVYAAELHITSGLAAVVFALLVLPNAVMARVFFGERMSVGFVAGSVVAMAGVALLFVQEARQTVAPIPAVLTGLGLTILAVLAASISNVMQLSEGMRSRSIAVMLAWAMLYGALIDGVFSWAMHGSPVVETRLGYWLGLLYLGVVASALAFWLYYRIIRTIGAARAAYSSVLIPIMAMALSTLFEGYRWSPLALAGGLLGIAGLVIALRSRRVTPPPPAD